MLIIFICPPFNFSIVARFWWLLSYLEKLFSANVTHFSANCETNLIYPSCAQDYLTNNHLHKNLKKNYLQIKVQLSCGHTDADNCYTLDARHVQSPLKCIFPFELHGFVQGMATLMQQWRTNPVNVAHTAQGIFLKIRTLHQSRAHEASCHHVTASSTGYFDDMFLNFYPSVWPTLVDKRPLLKYFICGVAIVRASQQTLNAIKFGTLYLLESFLY